MFWPALHLHTLTGSLHPVSILRSSGLAKRAPQPVFAPESSGKLSHLYSGKGDFQMYDFGSQNVKVSLEGEGEVLLHL